MRRPIIQLAALFTALWFSALAAEPQETPAAEGPNGAEQSAPLWGFIDRQGESAIPPQYTDADSFSEGLAAVQIEGKFGFINRAGQLVIAAEYDFAAPFSSGYARVDSGRRQYFIDKAGRRAFELRIRDDGGATDGVRIFTRMAEGRLLVHDPASRRSIYLDSSGRMAFPQTFEEGQPFREGLAAVRLRDRWGFVDQSGRMAIAPRFSFARPFSEGLAFVVEGERQGFIDRRGAFVFEIDTIVAPLAVNSFSEGLVKVTRNHSFESGHRFGYLDRSGRLAIPYQFDTYFAEDHYANFSEGLAIVFENGRIGFIDREGRIAISPRFADARPFREGFALVQLSGAEGDLFGFIDRSGTMAIEARYTAARSFSEGLAAVRVGR